MNKVKSESFHFPLGFRDGPRLLRHAVGCDHHSGAVITHSAVNKDFRVGIVDNQGKKVRESLILRKRALPAHGDITHAETLAEFAFALTVPMQIDNDFDAHGGDLTEALVGGLGAAVERRGYLSEVG